jgi:hypothetical protein
MNGMNVSVECVVDIFPESCDNVDLYLFTISMYFSSLKYYYSWIQGKEDGVPFIPNFR